MFKYSCRLLLFIIVFNSVSFAENDLSFRLDVMPVLFKAGCNAGGCHGSARGKDGFMLSLFGYDPQGDYYRITEEMVGRRINRAVPDMSLLLLKAVGAVPHTGGECFTTDSEYYKTLLNWIKAGSPDDEGDVAEPVGITLHKTSVVFEELYAEHPMKVIAQMSDGSSRDVTTLARYNSNNSSVVKVDENGKIIAQKPGNTHVFARYSRFSIGVEIIVLPKAENFKWTNPPISNYVDQHVFSRLQYLKINPSERCDDDTFLRRVTFDLAARPPTTSEYESFKLDTSPNKRSTKIEELLKSDDFNDLWTGLWAEMLRLMGGNYAPVGTHVKAAEALKNWLYQQIKSERPLNQMVSDLVTANGSNLKNGPTNLYTMLVHGPRLVPKNFAADFSQLFLGTQIQCAECHNHPFDRWTMDDYYSFVSFFTGIKRKPGIEAREKRIFYDASAAPASHKVDGRPMPAKVLGGLKPAKTENGDPRKALAKWLTAPENKLFSRNLSNRIWAQMMGKGLVEPVDDIRVSNPPANEPLLKALSEKLVQSNFNLRTLVRDICNSRVYQLSSKPTPSNQLDTRQFSRSYMKRLRADTLIDNIVNTSGMSRNFSGFPAGTKAIEHYPIVGGDTSGPHHGDGFFKIFGRSNRSTINASETKKEPTLSQTLHMMVGSSVGPRVPLNGMINNFIRNKLEPKLVLKKLFIQILSREPTPNETSKLLDLIETTGHNKHAYEDIVWALMNTAEFGFNL